MCRAWEEQKELGIEQGIGQGIEKGIDSVILRMKEKEIPIEQIADLVGTSIEHIRKVIKG